MLSVHIKTRPKGRVFAYRGFTMVELIVVIIVLGIIAVVSGSRFFTTSKFTEMGFADTTANSLRYAHKIAMASGCATRVQVTSASISLFQRANDCDSGAFTRAVSRPGGNSSWVEPVPSGVVVSNLDIYFDAVGSPHSHPAGNKLTTASTVSVGTTSVTIEPDTGYVHNN